MIPIDILKEHILTCLDGRDMHSMRQACTQFKESLDQVAEIKHLQMMIRNDANILGSDVWIFNRALTGNLCSLYVAINVEIDRAVLRRSCVPELEMDTIMDQVLVDQSTTETGKILVTCLVPLKPLTLDQQHGGICIEPLCYFQNEMSMYRAHEVSKSLDLHVRYMLLQHAKRTIDSYVQRSPDVYAVVEKSRQKLNSVVSKLASAVAEDVGMASINMYSTFANGTNNNNTRIVRYICRETYDDTHGFLLNGLHLSELAIKTNGTVITLEGHIIHDGLDDDIFPGECSIDLCPKLLAMITEWARLRTLRS